MGRCSEGIREREEREWILLIILSTCNKGTCLPPATQIWAHIYYVLSVQPRVGYITSLGLYFLIHIMGKWVCYKFYEQSAYNSTGIWPVSGLIITLYMWKTAFPTAGGPEVTPIVCYLQNEWSCRSHAVFLTDGFFLCWLSPILQNQSD
jgi:hypothetical protein